MLDGILGRGFASKCKSLIKQVKSRIDVIRRKRNATEKFLKKDIADLLANGLDINAYGRAEGLINELTLTSCYGFIERCCDIVSQHLSIMQKQSECIDECKEAVSSLMFAAARFPKLPELRDLRDAFQERYGNFLECFVNQGFVENVSSKSSTMEKKVLLMQDIATEFSIKWDSNAFQKRMSKPPLSAQDQPKYYGSPYTHDQKSQPINGKNDASRGVNHDVSSKDRPEDIVDGNRLHLQGDLPRRTDLNLQFKQEFSSNGYKPHNGREETILKGGEDEMLFQQRREVPSQRNENLTGNEDSTLKTNRAGCSSHRRKKESNSGFKLHDYRDNTTSDRDGQYTSPYAKPDMSFQERREVPVEKHANFNGNEDAALKTNGVRSSHRKKMESVEGELKLHDYRDNIASNRDSQYSSPYSKPDTFPDCAGFKGKGVDLFSDNNNVTQTNTANPGREAQVDEVQKLKPYCSYALPPPYVKPNVKPKDSKYGTTLGFLEAGFDDNLVTKVPSAYNAISSGRNRSERIEVGSNNLDKERHVIGPARASSHGLEKDHNPDDSSGHPFPKPRSSRRRRPKSRSIHEDVGDLEDPGVVKRRSRSRRKDDSRRGLQVLFDDEHDQNDEEERIIDKLLIHYSKKPSAYDPGRVRRKSKSHAHEHDGKDVDKSPKSRGRDGPDEMPEAVPPVRSVSLPREPTGTSKATKVFSRAASFQPDRSNPARHVHPKLPDYDDLAARFAALKGR
ncbi:hypothetical protein HS088_TW04G00554 [Tripterygium wilfordii]|uniref:Regulator of Vps4 activity in the MVB pathway protein n=1 Tax=Tripterygium wilfordii TaxID=458696 RepID=A0A7J7DR62_TRIWF|nr:uncharacterized protein LOC119995914 [Tripterygium wilfordii]XP_038698316.1 uncharacterized protein LOC119995914 [Tripterygium wilfordii]XP_038698317.1 uncharacterized protein LOC119995914 [Tripterygium wilfordii]KAF5748596.1 hypothetical protein HS088_TW04G00554 [Tripterygium wilfordii]